MRIRARPRTQRGDAVHPGRHELRGRGPALRPDLFTNRTADRTVAAWPRLDEPLAHRPAPVLDELVAGRGARPGRLGDAQPDDEVEVKGDQAYEAAGYDEHVERVEAG